jgi:hypothetical protein
MEKQYFMFKIKEQYLPDVIRQNIGKCLYKDAYTYTYYIDKKYLRKLKIKNIENDISEENKILINYLINDNFIDMISNERYKMYFENGKCPSGPTGISGSTGISGPKGISGLTGLM